MSKPIEVRLKIPKNSKAPLLDENGYPVDMASVRFRRSITVEAIPKPGETLHVSAGDKTVEATVIRVDWSDDDGVFVVACQYAKRSITVDEQSALVNDPDWQMAPLI